MSFEMTSCGVVGQTMPIPNDRIEQIGTIINTEVKRLIQSGVTFFLVAITGTATLMLAEAVIAARTQTPDIELEVLLPYRDWCNEQSEAVHYQQVVGQAHTVLLACEVAHEDSANIANLQLMGFGRCMVVIHHESNKSMQQYIADARDAEQDVHEIII